MNTECEDYETESKYLKELSREEVMRKKGVLRELLLSAGIKDERIGKAINDYKNTPIRVLTTPEMQGYNLLDLMLKEEKLLMKPEDLRCHIKESRKSGGEGLIMDVYIKEGGILLEPDYNCKSETLDEIAKNLGYSL